MPDAPTTRFGFESFSGSDLIKSIDDEMRPIVALLEAKAAICLQGLLSARPGSPVDRTFYYATNTDQLFYWTGTSWWQLAGPARPDVHTWTVDDQSAPTVGSTRLGSMFARPKAAQTWMLTEAVIHCESVASPASVFKVRTDTGHHGTLADVPGLAALTPSTTVQVVSADAPLQLASLDRITVELVTPGTAEGWTVQLTILVTG